MPSMRDIKRRIKSVQNIQQITRAMKMVAGARLRRAQERLNSMRPFARKIAHLCYEVLEDPDSVEVPALKPANSEAPPTVVLFTGERGLCGAFNSSLIKAGMHYLEKLGLDKPTSLVTIGHKGKSFFHRMKARNRLGDVELVEWPEIDTAASLSRFEEISGRVENDMAEGSSSGLVVIYSLFHTVVNQEVVRHSLLPLDREAMKPLIDMEDPATHDYEMEPDQNKVVRAIVRRFLATQLYRAFIENWTSEMGARMTAMDAATNNAEELTGELTLEYNKARQAAITAEIVDIAGGAEALRQQ